MDSYIGMFSFFDCVGMELRYWIVCEPASVNRPASTGQRQPASVNWPV